MKLGLLISGALGYHVLEELFGEQDLVFVMTDKGSQSIIDFCCANNINYYAGNCRKDEAHAFYADKKIEVLVSANYLFLITEPLISLASRLSFNVHGSLLPRYRGRTPHVWAIINNESKTGITAHKIDEGCDTGDIIEQVEVVINTDDTGADVLARFYELYPSVIRTVLQKVENNDLAYRAQSHEYAIFFGKRVPEDGEICWDWQKERIHNWVRAQAYPYPGAFTFAGEEKLIIDKIKFTDYGFDHTMPNGMVLCLNPLLVKVGNGVIEIVRVRNMPMNLSVNQILGINATICK